MFGLPILFAAFGLWWWLVVVAMSCLIIYNIDKDRGLWATFFLVVGGLSLLLFGDPELPAWLASNPGVILFAAFLYFAIGSLWGLVKWYLYVTDRRSDYDDMKRQWLRERNQDPCGPIPEDLKQQWTEHLKTKSQYVFYTTQKVQRSGGNGHTWEATEQVANVRIAPAAWENKSRISRWMTFWPWSMVWTLLDDIVRNIFKRIQRALNELMERISTRAFRGTEDDVVKPAK
jgi:hypothetical protein